MADINDMTTANTSQVAVAGKRIEAIHCLTIPLMDESVILPNAAVAEVIGYSKPELPADAPEWFLGWLNWRDRRIPVISFEAASGKSVSSAVKNSRIAILNTLNGNSHLPYIGLLTQGIPSLQLVREDTFSTVNDAGLGRQSISAVIDTDSHHFVVPNIDDLENRVQRLHLI